MAVVSKINGYNVKDANAQAEIENIKNGKTIVQNARVALNANTATNYDTAGGTIKDKFTDHESKINNHQVEINNIKNGTTTVGKANNANTAAAATQANNYNTSTGTIKSKFDELEEKIGSGGSLSPAGSTNRPIYINSSGNPATIIVSDSITAAALTSSDTNLATVRDIYYGTPTINGSKAYTSATNIYAPTSRGILNQLLSSQGSSKDPIFEYFNECAYYSYNLNNSTEKYVQFNANSSINSLMIQAGTKTAGGSGAVDVAITFPRPFYSIPHVVATYYADASTQNYYSWVRLLSKSGFTCRGYSGYKILWIAIGVGEI